MSALGRLALASLKLGPQVTQEVVMTYGEMLIEQGRKEGEARGEARGEAKGKAQMLVRLLAQRGLPCP